MYMKYIFIVTCLNAMIYSNSMCITPNLNNPTRICNNCIHYIANEKKCGLFFDVDMVTGDKTYQNACTVRNSELKCGNDAKYYSENDFKLITVPFYFLKEYNLPITVGFIWILWIYSVTYYTNTQ